MTVTFKQFLLNEDEAKNKTNAEGLSSQLKQIINQFLLPAVEDNKEYRKRMLLGREVLHTIESAAKSAIVNDKFDANKFKSEAKSAVVNLLTPPASEKTDREKFPSIASAFNNKVINYIVSKLKNSDDVKNTISQLLGNIGEKWNQIARQTSKDQNRSEERQMSRKYDQSRSIGGKSTKRQTYKNIEKRAERGQR